MTAILYCERSRRQRLTTLVPGKSYNEWHRRFVLDDAYELRMSILFRLALFARRVGVASDIADSFSALALTTPCKPGKHFTIKLTIDDWSERDLRTAIAHLPSFLLAHAHEKVNKKRLIVSMWFPPRKRRGLVMSQNRVVRHLFEAPDKTYLEQFTFDALFTAVGKVLVGALKNDSESEESGNVNEE